MALPLALGLVGSVSSTSGGYSVAHRSASFAQANVVAALKPDIGGHGFMDRVRAVHDVGLRYGLDDQWHVRQVTDRYYRVNHPASITYGSRSWYPGAAMQPPDGHDHNQVLHSDSGGARGTDMFGIDPTALKHDHDTAAVPGARGWGAGALYGGRCVRGADTKIFKVLDGLNGGGGEDNAVDGSLSAILKDSLRNDSLDVVDFNNITATSQYFIENGRVFLNDDRSQTDGSADASCAWIAGQTARGSGFGLQGAIWLRDGFMHDLLISGMHYYHDSQSGTQPLGIFSGQDILLWENTFWLGNTENFLIQTGCADDHGSGDWYPQLTARVSVMRNISGESYATNWVIGGCKGSVAGDSTTMIDSDSIPNGYESRWIDVAQNFFTRATHRSPRGNGVDLRLVENVWYSWSQAAVELQNVIWADIIDGFFHGGGSGPDRLDHRAVQQHMETGGDPFDDVTINTNCANRVDPNGECIQFPWQKEQGGNSTHPLYPDLDAAYYYLKGNKTEKTRFLADDSIQFRAMSKYHDNATDSLPETEYDSLGLCCTTYHPSDTIAANSSDPWIGLRPDSMNGEKLTKDTANTESPIPLDSPWTADSAFQQLVEQTGAGNRELGAWWQLNADGTRRIERDSAELLMLENAADTASNVASPNDIDSLENTYLGKRPPWDSGSSWTDTDGDGCPDEYEEAFAADSVAMDCMADPDEDGRSNYLEFLAGPESDPTVANDPSYGAETSADAINLIPIIHHHRRPGSGPNPGRVH